MVDVGGVGTVIGEVEGTATDVGNIWGVGGTVALAYTVHIEGIKPSNSRAIGRYAAIKPSTRRQIKCFKTSRITKSLSKEPTWPAGPPQESKIKTGNST